MRIQTTRDGLNPVVRGLSVQNEEPVLGCTLPGINKEGSFDFRFVPFALEEFVQRHLEFYKKIVNQVYFCFFFSRVKSVHERKSKSKTKTIEELQ